MPGPAAGAKEAAGARQGPASRRTSGQGWSGAVAPRFERRMEAGAGTAGQEETSKGETKHIFYDGELCEAETLPNGFTKIRQ